MCFEENTGAGEILLLFLSTETRKRETCHGRSCQGRADSSRAVVRFSGSRGRGDGNSSPTESTFSRTSSDSHSYWRSPFLRNLTFSRCSLVIILAGLQSISTVLYEAAAIDGSNKWNQFLYITLPQLRNTLIFVILVTSILAFRLFDQVQIMTQGGPNRATTTVMYESVKAAFEQQKMAKGAAMTVVFFLIVLAITMVQRFLVKEERAIE